MIKKGGDKNIKRRLLWSVVPFRPSLLHTINHIHTYTHICTHIAHTHIQQPHHPKHYSRQSDPHIFLPAQQQEHQQRQVGYKYHTKNRGLDTEHGGDTYGIIRSFRPPLSLGSRSPSLVNEYHLHHLRSLTCGWVCCHPPGNGWNYAFLSSPLDISPRWGIRES